MPSVNYPLFLKFLKFSLVGFSGIFVDFGITYIFKEKVKIHKYIASSAGFVFATASNYYLNRVWTFKSVGASAIVQFEKFFIIACIGLIISNTLIYIFNDKLKYNFWVCKLSAIILVSFWNFFANYIYTFAT
ncbi:MAG: GtrA family protein [Sphingobacteriales bacterium]|nr:MAG: GtrA family protein [Sphingobacteriales bacterium]TAF78216.1 MAG: GtrA family protein [Sphingobacteriales bacterium]